MARSRSDRAALDAIAALLNTRRHPNDIPAALLLLIEVNGRVRETGRRVPYHRRKPFRILPKDEQRLRDAVQRCITDGYELGQISRIVLDVVKIPLVEKPPPRGFGGRHGRGL